MDEIVNKLRGKNKRPDMKKLILSDDMFIWGKDFRETEEKLTLL
jgi:hypothetical protein